MKIIYGYSNCTYKTYNRLMSENNSSSMLPDQKYHSVMIQGFEKNGAEVRCFSGLPVNRSVTSRKIVREPDEREGNAYFHYITTVNYPVIRQLMIFFGTFFGVLGIKKDKETFAVCDILNAAAALGLSLACKLRGIKRTAIVTDLPDMFESGGFSKAVRNFVLRRFDYYIFLTEQMADALGLNSPYIVIEGQIDSEVPPADRGQAYELQTGKKIVFYAGTLHEEYGVKNLAEGFIKASVPDSELWIYGDGVYRDDLIELTKDHPEVVYKGIKSNSEIVAEEQRAALLVNPRFTYMEYTKYSFPSKNMEYMASGTPLLTTKLPGMPKEYYPYVYLIEEETPEGMAKALESALSKPFSERIRLGDSAREFVFCNKTNVKQTKKIIDFLQREQKQK